MLLLWIGSRDKAGEELAIVARDFPDAPLGQIAAELGATGGAATAAATTAP